MYAVGIDSGTQGTKALIVEMEGGRVRGRGFAPHAMIENLRPGESEQEPASWVLALEQAVASALEQSAVDPKRIVALGVSGQQHGFVPLDKRGEPIRPAKLWNDTSTVGETEMILGRLGGPKAFIENLGINLAVGFTASKILWLKTHEPENFRKLATVLLPHNYLNYRLTGKLGMEYGDASGTGLMDIRRRAWSPDALEAIDPDLERKLPRLEHPREPLGYMRPQAASRFGFGKVLVSSGGGDNMMAAIGTGNIAPGVCTLSLGTSGTIFSYSPEPCVDPAGEIAAFCDSTGGWLPLLCTMNVTNTTERLKKLMALTNESLEKLAAQAAPGAGGLLFLPFVDGERVPALPYASGVFFGLNRQNFDRANMARAVMEGTIFNLGYGFSRMRKLGVKPSEIRATGGGAKSRAWLQIAADIFETPVVTLKEREAAAYGAALQSIWCYRRDRGSESGPGPGIEDIVRGAVKMDRLAAEPNRANSARYASLGLRFNSLWKTLGKEFTELKKLSA